MFHCNNDNHLEANIMKRIQEKGEVVESIVADIIQDAVFAPGKIENFVEPANTSQVLCIGGVGEYKCGSVTNLTP